MDPVDRQAVTLAALDRLIEIAEAADKSRWMADVARTANIRMRTEDDARYLVSVTPGSVLLWLRGRRSILVRHAPEWCEEGHWVCACGFTHAWPDGDWRDAAIGLEVGDA